MQDQGTAQTQGYKYTEGKQETPETNKRAGLQTACRWSRRQGGRTREETNQNNNRGTCYKKTKAHGKQTKTHSTGKPRKKQKQRKARTGSERMLHRANATKLLYDPFFAAVTIVSFAA